MLCDDSIKDLEGHGVVGFDLDLNVLLFNVLIGVLEGFDEEIAGVDTCGKELLERLLELFLPEELDLIELFEEVH